MSLSLVLSDVLLPAESSASRGSMLSRGLGSCAGFVLVLPGPRFGVAVRVQPQGDWH